MKSPKMMISMQKQVFAICFILFSLFGLLDGITFYKMKTSYKKPMNCARYECPSYKVIRSVKDYYEIRRYKYAVWASSSQISSNSFTEAANKGFITLFNYTKGNNNRAANVNLTAPVLIDIYASNGPTATQSYIVYFYVPKKYQKRPPVSDEVQLAYLPRHEFAAVRRFGGFINDTNIATELIALKKSLQGTSWQSATSAPQPYSVAAYNAPFETQNRVNEIIIWFDKRTCQ